MDALKPGSKALLPLADALALGPSIALKAAIAQAAAQNGANANALAAARYRAAPKGPQRGNRLLTGQEEAKLAGAVQRLSHNNKVLTLPLLRSLALELFGKEPSKDWAHEFLTRHPAELNASAARQLCQARNNQESLVERANDFIKQLEKFLKKKNFLRMQF